MTHLAIVLLGLLIGMVSGATGIGGGTLVAPFLIFVLRIDPFVSVGTDLFVSVITKAVGSLIHKRENNIENSSLLPLCIAGVVGALTGAAALEQIKAHLDVHAAQSLLRHVIGATLCICSIAIALSSRIRARHEQFDNPGFLGAVGGIVAAITTVTGVGVGSLSVPALYFAKGRATMSRVVGTSLVFATIVTAIGTIAHIILHDVNYRLSALLLVGSIPGVIGGSLFSTRTPALLKPVVIALLLISGADLIVA